jgi:2-polyprenyl-3-methyl-5-hydroxy-6-metoxy-1,4-benzoquinol methylase
MNTGLNADALRYSFSYEQTLGNKYSRNRILVAMVGDGDRVLELGCNSGFISRHLKDKNCRVTGIEIDPAAAQIARSWCDRVLTCDINQPEWIASLEGPFDTIICGDVLEHLVNPSMVLKSLGSLLTPGGKIVISLPNVAHWTVRFGLLLGNFNYQPMGILDATHLHFYTLKSAHRLIADSGYRVESFQPIVGGRFSIHLPWLWNLLTKLAPGLFAYQLMFDARASDAASTVKQY